MKKRKRKKRLRVSLGKLKEIRIGQFKLRFYSSGGNRQVEVTTPTEVRVQVRNDE